MPQASDVAMNARRFRRHIRAVGLSTRTGHSYVESVEAMARFLAEPGMPLDAEIVSGGIGSKYLHRSAPAATSSSGPAAVGYSAAASA